MTSRPLVSLLAIAAMAGALAAPVRALEIAEAQGDFYYDSEGDLVGLRAIDLPAVREPMSHKEKLRRAGLQLPPAGFRTSLVPRREHPKPDRIEAHDGVRANVILVKFRDDREVRLRSGRLSADGAALASVETILGGFPQAQLRRAVETDERIIEDNRETGQILSGRELPDLNNWYQIVLPEGATDGVEIATALNGLPEVEVAYLEAIGVAPSCVDVAPATTDLEPNQFYRDAAPAGVDIGYAEAYHNGGNGTPGYWVIDMEWDWCQSHEDLNFATADILNGSTPNIQSTMWHGTAVLGVIGSCDNGYGTTGLTPDVTLKALDRDSAPSWGSMITTADGWLYPGEIMLLEVALYGPVTGQTCNSACTICPPNPASQFESVPVEWDLLAFDAISIATANGVLVVEAAGNGSMNLDDPVYGGAFDRTIDDSGAIVVGASDTSHAPMCWTNFGSRVDVHAYGRLVTTTGYGDAFDGVPGTCDQEYTASFNGTSSASPIIVGVCASVQGIAMEKYGVTISPSQMRALIQVGGTPQTGTNNIGPMPNLVWAINEIEPDMIPYTPSGWSYTIVPRTGTGSTQSSAPLAAGPLNGYGTMYLNWSDQNNPAAYAPTVNSPNNAIYVDDVLTFQGGGAPLNPGDWLYYVDIATIIKGGRHNLRLVSDWLDVEEEWIETNNVWSRQYIWTGRAMAEDAPTSDSHDPVAVDAAWTGPFYNAEGLSVFSSTSSSYWSVFAVAPTSSGDDFDIRLNTEAPGNIPQTGFGASVVSSFTAPGEIAWVAWDLNEVPSGQYWASVLNFAGTSDKVMEYDNDDGTLGVGAHGPFTMQANDLVDVHELFLPAGLDYRVHVQVLSGSADVGLSVLDGTSGYHDKVGTVLPGGFADAAGPGQDEFVIVTPPITDYHGAVVWKKGAADVSQTVTYVLIVSTSPNLVGNRTASSWDSPIVPRNSADAFLLVDLPATLNGDQPTTSWNWATYNEGANQAVGPWETELYLDDVFQFGSTAGTIGAGTFWVDMNNPQVTVPGGRHHARSTADVLSQVTEFNEGDNNFTDWFVWSPLDLATPPGTRGVPSYSSPLGYGPWYSCDGYTATATSYWTGVAIEPIGGTDDYDLRVHTASTGSKNGFDAPLASSYDGPGLTDFVIVNHNVAAAATHDFGVLRLGGGIKGFEIGQADAPFHGIVPPGVSRYGPFSIGGPEPLQLHEVFIDTDLVGVPVYVSLHWLSGYPDLGIAVYDGAVPYHDKLSAMALVDAAPPGEDEHLAPIVFPAPNYYAVAVFKTGSAGVYTGGTYELVFSTGSSAVDAPEVSDAPTEFALAAPSPNPFRTGATTVRFDLPVPTDVRVRVYDLAGRRVATVAEGMRPAGRHSVRWDGRDGAGRRVGAGVYFVRLESGEFTESRKITLLR